MLFIYATEREMSFSERMYIKFLVNVPYVHYNKIVTFIPKLKHFIQSPSILPFSEKKLLVTLMSF